MIHEPFSVRLKRLKRECAEEQAVAVLLETVKAWRGAEKRHAAMTLGAIGGDLDAAKGDADRALHAVRIAADNIEARKGEA